MKNRYIKLFFISCTAIILASGVYGAESIDIEAQIKALEKKIQKAADIEAIKALMTGMQHGVMRMSGSPMSSNVTKTPGQCFGQNDGYVYGNFGKVVSQRQGGGGGPGGPVGAPGQAAPGGQSGPAGGQGGAPGGSAPGAAPGGQGGPSAGVLHTSLDFHILTTAVIEVADDGLTAKAVWYSPGILSEPGRGNDEYMTAWIYELYACDFVKEDGVWKNWHRTLSTDFMTSVDKSWTDTKYTKAGEDEIARIGGILERTQTGELKVVEAAEGQTLSPVASQSFKDIKTVAYQSWTRETMPQYKPKPPVPYNTFSETYSYCPPMPEDVSERLESEGNMF